MKSSKNNQTEHGNYSDESEREKESNRIWRNIRQRGDLSCHSFSIPKKCANGICDSYPEVKLCMTCKRCPCDY